jgi:hypothetical protein
LLISQRTQNFAENVKQAVQIAIIMLKVHPSNQLATGSTAVYDSRGVGQAF